MWRRVGWLGLATVTVTTAIFACRQTLGIDQYFNASAEAGSEAGTSACRLPYGTSLCASCISVA
jgi:hypothetical protein